MTLASDEEGANSIDSGAHGPLLVPVRAKSAGENATAFDMILDSMQCIKSASTELLQSN